jgi:hypothetical protein
MNASATQLMPTIAHSPRLDMRAHRTILPPQAPQRRARTRRAAVASAPKTLTVEANLVGRQDIQVSILWHAAATPRDHRRSLAGKFREARCWSTRTEKSTKQICTQFAALAIQQNICERFSI